MEQNPNANQNSKAAAQNKPNSEVVIKTQAIEDDDNKDEEGDEVEELAENLMDKTKKISKNDFILVRVIGRGSFGKVFMVRKKDKPSSIYALKVLAKNVLQKRNLMIKTQGKLLTLYDLAERDILEKIESPFIVKLHYAF